MDQRAGSRSLIALVLALAASAGADEILLADGRTLAGEVESRGATWRVRTGGGVVEIPAESVASELLARESEGLDPGDADDWYLLAERLAARGLPGAERAALERCLELDPEHWSANERMGRVRSEGRWVEAGEYLADRRVPLPPAPADEGIPDAGPERVSALALRLAGANARFRSAADAAGRAEPLVDREDASRELSGVLLGDEDPACRRLAADAFGEAREIMGTKSLVRSAVADRTAEVREASTGALLAIGWPGTPALFEAAVHHANPAIRLNALAALGRFNSFPAAQVLIRRIQIRHPGGPRANIFVGRQTAYIRDFDVQVAQNATIADPVIGVLQEGAVLDAKVLWIDEVITIEERTSLYGNLRRFAGVDLPDDREAWLAWWRENEARLEAEFRAHG